MDLFLEKFPPTVDLVVEKILADLPFKERTRIGNMSEAALIDFHESYGAFIRSNFRLPGNTPLMLSCQKLSGIEALSSLQASYIILKALQERLQEEHILKVVK